MKSPLKHLDFLDGLRGVAILCVLLFHTGANVNPTETAPCHGWFRDFSNAPLSTVLLFPMRFGQAGVPIFFVISGFCIHLSFHQQGGKWAPFFIRRFFRIYPAYIAALLLSTFLFYLAHFRASFLQWEAWQQFLSHLFLVHNFWLSTISGINGSLWSLAVEAQLYLVYPVLLAIVARLGWRRSLVMLAGCQILISFIMGVVEITGTAGTIGGTISWFFSASVLDYWFSWAAGALIADAYLKNQTLPFSKISTVWWLVLAFTTYLIRPLAYFEFLFFSLAAAAFISRRLTGCRPPVRFPVLSTGLLQKIGLWSYSLYLLHQPLLNLYCKVVVAVVPGEYRSTLPAFMLMLVTWLAIIPLSILWYQVFELPGIALGRWIVANRFGGYGKRDGTQKSQPGRPAGMMRARYLMLAGTLALLIIGNFVVQAKFTPPSPRDNNNFAWALVISPDASTYNGIRAVAFAEKACAETNYKDALFVGTLAAAYAEAARFDDAISTAQKACTLAAANGETNLLQRNQELLKIYQAHQPYHDGK